MQPLFKRLHSQEYVFVFPPSLCTSGWGLPADVSSSFVIPCQASPSLSRSPPEVFLTFVPFYLWRLPIICCCPLFGMLPLFSIRSINLSVIPKFSNVSKICALWSPSCDACFLSSGFAFSCLFLLSSTYAHEGLGLHCLYPGSEGSVSSMSHRRRS